MGYIPPYRIGLMSLSPMDFQRELSNPIAHIQSLWQPNQSLSDLTYPTWRQVRSKVLLRGRKG